MIVLVAVLASTSDNGNYLLVGIASVITASAGGYALWKKLKPETTNIHVGSSSQLIEMAVRAGTFVEGQRDSLNKEVKELKEAFDHLEDRLDIAEAAARTAEQRANRAEARADRAERKYEEEKERRRELEDEVHNLRREVAAMRHLIEESDITIPPDLLNGEGNEASNT
jgi:outer membrane murein-binding lipoprotein Lpp